MVTGSDMVTDELRGTAPRGPGPRVRLWAAAAEQQRSKTAQRD
jgi:hypothetical protein